MPRRTRTPAPTPEHHARPAERATWSPEELSKFSTQVADSLRLVHSDLQQRPGGWFTGTGYDAQPTELWLAMYEPWLRQEAQGILGNEVERRDFVKGIDQDLQRGYCLDSVIETVRDTTPDAWKAGVRDTVTAQLQALQGEAYGAMRADEKMARTGQAGLLLVDAFAHEGANSWRTRAYNAYAGVVGYPEDPDLIHGVLAADLFVRAALGQQPHPELVTKLREYADHLLHGSSHNSMNPLTDIDTRIAMQMARALNGQSSKNRSAQHSYMQTVAQAARYDIDSLSAATTTAPKPAKQRRQPSHPATHAPVATPAATTLPYPQDPHGPTDISFLTESADSAARRRRIAFSATAVAAVVGVGLVASPAAAEDGSSTVRRAPSTVRIEIAPDTSVAPAAPEQTTTPGGIRRSGGVSRAQARVLRDQAEQARQAPAPSENSVEGRRRLADNLRLSIAAALRTNELTGLPAAVQGMTQLGLLEGWFTGDPLQNELTRGLTESKNLPTLAAGYSREAAAWLTLLAQYPSLATSSANSQLVQQLTFRGFEQDAPVFEMYLQQNKAGYEAVLFEQQSRDAYPGEIANHLVRLLALADFYNLSEERVQGFRDQYAQAEAERVAEEERVANVDEASFRQEVSRRVVEYGRTQGDPEVAGCGVIMGLLFEIIPNLQPYHVAGVLGNLDVESVTCDPTVEQHGGGPGKALAQWGSSDPRLDRFGYGEEGLRRFGTLRWFASQSINADRGNKWEDPIVQVRFIKWELENTQKHAYQHLLEATNAEEAAHAFMKYYERPRNQTESGFAPRREDAQKYIDLYNSIAADLQPANQETP